MSACKNAHPHEHAHPCMPMVSAASMHMLSACKHACLHASMLVRVRMHALCLTRKRALALLHRHQRLPALKAPHEAAAARVDCDHAAVQKAGDKHMLVRPASSGGSQGRRAGVKQGTSRPPASSMIHDSTSTLSVGK
eukprot:362987-Chlamydomonas_euryale.AAC.10